MCRFRLIPPFADDLADCMTDEVSFASNQLPNHAGLGERRIRLPRILVVIVEKSDVGKSAPHKLVSAIYGGRCNRSCGSNGNAGRSRMGYGKNRTKT